MNELAHFSAKRRPGSVAGMHQSVFVLCRRLSETHSGANARGHPKDPRRAALHAVRVGVGVGVGV